MQDTPLQPKQIIVKTTPYCLHVPFFHAQSILQPYLTIFNSSGGATCLFILIGIIPCFVSCQPILRGPAQSPLSTLVSDDISKAHTVVQHLKWVHELQFLRNVESVWTFSHDINVQETYQEFSPFCHLAEVAESEYLNRFRNS